MRIPLLSATLALALVAAHAQDIQLFYGGTVRGTTEYNGMRFVTMSPDGRHLYAAAYSGNIVAVLSRDNATGEIVHVSQVEDGVDSVDGLAGARCVVVSDDGRHVYVAAANDHAVAWFEVGEPVAASAAPADRGGGGITVSRASPASIETTIPSAIPGQLTVYDPRGRLVTDLSSKLSRGSRGIAWRGRVGGGVYILTARTDAGERACRFLLR